MFFNNYNDARRHAIDNNLPLWDSRRLIDRYYVGHLSIEMEEDESIDWEEIFVDFQHK